MDAILVVNAGSSSLKFQIFTVSQSKLTRQVRGQLDGIGTVGSRFTITPFVGFLAAPPRLVPDPREVERVLEVPLSELLDPDIYRQEFWDTWIDDLDIHFYELADETVWGATARILTNFLTHLTTGRL